VKTVRWTVFEATEEINMEINEVTGIIVDAAMAVHSALGPGLLERPYLACHKYELIARGLKCLSEVAMPVVYKGVEIDIGYRLDLLVEDQVIVEVKSIYTLAPIHRMQLLTYLRLANKPVGLLINFGAAHLRDGISRVINSPSAASESSENPLRFSHQNLTTGWEPGFLADKR
jgi:GxxExxY protein